MGLVYADVELINATDLVMAKKNMIGEEEVKRMSTNIMVDSGGLDICLSASLILW